MSSRIPYPPESAHADRDFGRPMLNIEKMLHHLPRPTYDAFAALATELLWRGTLSAQLRELAILRVGYHEKSAYELHHHRAISLAVGLSEAKIAAATGEDHAALAPDEAAVVRFADEIILNTRPSDEALAELRRHLDDAQMFELVLAVGYYMTVCRVIEITDVEPEPFTLDPSGGSRRT